MGSNVGIILSEFMDDATIGGVQVDRHRFTGCADLFYPTFGAFGNAVGALTFVVGNIDIYASDFCAPSGETLRNDILKTTKIVCVLPY